MKKTDSQINIDELLTRGVGDFIDPDNAFRKKLETNPEKIVIKFGVDPNRPDIHIGHAVVLRKLRMFQDLGCKVIFLIGDITAQIGDPTGKSKVRPEINQQEIEENMRTFLDQVNAILSIDPKVFSWITNSDWYVGFTDVHGDGVDYNKKMQTFISTRMQLKINGNTGFQTTSLINFLAILRKITHARLIERDMFQNRINEGKELYMHEMMYPVLQGIDSNVICKIYGSCDLEVGGTDQTFNMLMGRDVMKVTDQEQQAVLAFKILPGLDGKEKMSKSLDNYIGITDKPNDMYGKVMSIPDSVIAEYFELCTDISLEEIATLTEQMKKGEVNPRDIKMRLARSIVGSYHSERDAIQAEDNFIATFSKKEIPEDIETAVAASGEKLSELLVRIRAVESKSEFRRLVEQGGVHNLTTGVKVEDQFIDATPATYKIGKHRFIKIV